MPFKSQKQRRYMFIKHPKIAEKWAHESESKSHEKKESKKKKLKEMMTEHGRQSKAY